MGNNQTSQKYINSPERSNRNTLRQRRHSSYQPNCQQTCFPLFAQGEKFYLLPWHRNFLQCIKQVDRKNPQAQWVFAIKKIILKPDKHHDDFLADINSLKFLKLPQQEEKRRLTNAEVQKLNQSLRKSILMDYQDVIKKQSRKECDYQELLSQSYHPRKNSYHLNIQHTQFSLKKNSLAYLRDSVMRVGRNIQETQKSQYLSANFKNSDVQKVDRNPTVAIAVGLQKFIKLTEKLQCHLNNQQNILNRIKMSFLIFLKQKYGQLIEKKSEYLRKQSNFQQFLLTVKLFIKIYTKIVIDYYQLQNFGNSAQFCLISKQENIQIFVSTHLFKEDNFSYVVYGIFDMFYDTDSKFIAQIYSSLAQMKPNEFGVPVQYSLNEQTLNKFNKMIPYSILQLSNSEKKSSFSLTEQQFQTNTYQNYFTPYDACVNLLKKLAQNNTPVSKMKLITEVAQKITQQINNFYKINSIQVQNWYLDPDCILSIFSFLITRAKIANLQTHLALITQFSTVQQSYSIAGYYTSVTESALRNLQENYAKYLKVIHKSQVGTKQQ